MSTPEELYRQLEEIRAKHAELANKRRSRGGIDTTDDIPELRKLVALGNAEREKTDELNAALLARIPGESP